MTKLKNYRNFDPVFTVKVNTEQDCRKMFGRILTKFLDKIFIQY